MHITINLNDMDNVIFETFVEQLNRIERNTLLASKNVLNLDDVAYLTGLSKSHLYKLTCTHQIPYYKPSGKGLYFDRSEVENWMRQGKQETIADAQAYAASYIATH